MRCLARCVAATRHHTAVFPILAARYPELRNFLAGLERDHVVIAQMLTRLNTGVRGPAGRAGLDGLVAVLETRFIGEEKRPAQALNALEPTDGIIF